MRAARAWLVACALGVGACLPARPPPPRHTNLGLTISPMTLGNGRVMMRVGGSLGSSTGYGSISAGITYRY